MTEAQGQELITLLTQVQAHTAELQTQHDAMYTALCWCFLALAACVFALFALLTRR